MLVYGFDWRSYRELVMPAFARWLAANEVGEVEALYAATRLAYEEAFLPAAMQSARTWPRAVAFVAALPRGPHSLYEYRLLCSAEEFTALSDRYLYRHVPHLHRCSEALATVWSAIVEHYCVRGDEALATTEQQARARQAAVGLLSQPEEANGSPLQLSETYFEVASPDMEEQVPEGFFLGQHPNVLRLRGWLAALSPAALALFEYLACGRRALPFEDGFRSAPQASFSGTTLGHYKYIGYLTPAEVQRLAHCLRTVTAPEAEEAARDYDRFRQGLAAGQEQGQGQDMRLIDEVLPAYGASLLAAVRLAAAQGLGLICRQS
ncbi:hypothetical protein [Thermogemmatispora onikobensis]|uniref:hypothetical protein n=1 Tax=Thermogemmatispora onikobensis TaxID=732234 RepID=UPI000852D357|nr:hypothetical protein [Thermogemmatispora onikobensis]